MLGYLKVQYKILENANFSLIALKANVPPSLQITVQKPHPLNTHTLTYQTTRDNITAIHYVSLTGEKTL